MGIIVITVPTSGSPRTAASVANPLNVIKNEINGNLDNNNIKEGANIGWSKLAKSGSAFSDFGDTLIAGVATGDILYRSAAGKWVNLGVGAATTYLKGGTTPSWAAINLDDLADVNAPSPTEGQVLTRVGSEWVPGSAGLANVDTTGAVSTGTGPSNSAWVDVVNGSITKAWASGKKLLILVGGYMEANNDAGVSGQVRIFDATTSAELQLCIHNILVNNSTAAAPVGLAFLYTVPATVSRTIKVQVRNSRGNAPDQTTFFGSMTIIEVA